MECRQALTASSARLAQGEHALRMQPIDRLPTGESLLLLALYVALFLRIGVRWIGIMLMAIMRMMIPPIIRSSAPIAIG